MKQREVRSVRRRTAEALAWDFSVAKQVSPKQMLDNQTDGCQQRFLEQASDLLTAMRKAGLIVRIRGHR